MFDWSLLLLLSASVNYVTNWAVSDVSGTLVRCGEGIDALQSRLQVGERHRSGSAPPDVFFDNLIEAK